VFGAIARLWEDVDLRHDYCSLDSFMDPFTGSVSRIRLENFSEDSKFFVPDHARVLLTALPGMLVADSGTDTVQLELHDDVEYLQVHYPTVLEAEVNYLGNGPLIEYGGCNLAGANECVMSCSGFPRSFAVAGGAQVLN
jgi:hypothetical protein